MANLDPKYHQEQVLERLLSWLTILIIIFYLMIIIYLILWYNFYIIYNLYHKSGERRDSTVERVEKLFRTWKKESFRDEDLSLPTWQWINELLIGNHLASRIILLARPETIAFHKTPNPFYHVSCFWIIHDIHGFQVPFFLILVTSPISPCSPK